MAHDDTGTVRQSQGQSDGSEEFMELFVALALWGKTRAVHQEDRLFAAWTRYCVWLSANGRFRELERLGRENEVDRHIN